MFFCSDSAVAQRPHYHCNTVTPSPQAGRGQGVGQSK